jgi:hypothetical protein
MLFIEVRSGFALRYGSSSLRLRGSGSLHKSTAYKQHIQKVLYRKIDQITFSNANPKTKLFVDSIII